MQPGENRTARPVRLEQKNAQPQRIGDRGGAECQQHAEPMRDEKDLEETLLIEHQRNRFGIVGGSLNVTRRTEPIGGVEPADSTRRGSARQAAIKCP